MDTRLILPPEMPAFPPYVYYSPLLSPPECEKLIEIGEAKGLTFGTIGNGTNNDAHVDLSYRTARTCGIFPSDGDLYWLFSRIRDRVSATNRDYFRFDLHGLWENLVFLRYDPPTDGVPAGHYNWHQDFGGGYSSHRKLSIVVQLSSPQDYDGCRLKLFTDREFEPEWIGIGDAVIFPSWVPHCVTPITRGTRYALVGWISGPQFR